MELGAGGAKHRSTIFLKLSLVFSISSFSAIKINDLTAYLKSTQTQLVMITETNHDQRNKILSFLLKTTINLLTNVQNLHSSNFSSRACYPQANGHSKLSTPLCVKLFGRKHCFFQRSECSALSETYTVTIKGVNLCRKN